MKFPRWALAALLLLSTGCSRLFLHSGSPTATPEVTTPAPYSGPAGSSATPASTVAASATPDQLEGPQTLRIWVPPQFDPQAGTGASRLFQQRLDEFKARRPGITLEVRVKALDGPGGLLDELSSASAAAPDILPDLVALPEPMMDAAALKGLLHPYDGLSTVLESSDWYNYATQMAHIQKSTFGLPFAADALILMYRTTLVSEPPKVLSDTQTLQRPLVFPASDPQSLFTLTLYQAAGGAIQDQQGRPSLDAAVLTRVLSFYQKAAAVELMPTWLSQYETDDQSWAAFVQGKADLAVTWVSRYLMESSAQSKDEAAAILPTLDGTPYTISTGWVWSLAGSQIRNQAAAVQLAEFLTENDFMAQWTAAAGYLPTRISALSAWSDTSKRIFTGQVILSAHPYPPVDVLASLAPALRQATVQVLNKQGEPASLAQEAVNSLSNP